ncbi:hypothetical protein [Streptomyces odonnellii]|uniref:hypothetical protein n=1 Tax=Streptomyces odonnellii TaxID=1417980 RepID=UPI000625DD82|nr:hypothetical protein [Streptomyces odonnellii]
MSTPPAPGKGLSVRVDQSLYDDLAVMMRPGMTASDAVKYAVALTAGIYRGLSSSGLCPEGTMPLIKAVQVQLHEPRHTAAEGRMTGDGPEG